MKNKIMLLCLCLLSSLNTLQAQDSLRVKPQATAPYKAAIGARLSYGGPTGADISISAKYFIGKESALEAQSSIIKDSRIFLASLSYIWQPQLLTSSRFRPYAGLGLGVMRSHNYTYYPEEPDITTNLVTVASFGMEYTFKKAPISLSLDYRAPFMRFDNSPYQPRMPLEQARTIGVGVKFLLK
ncbi:hypothetical protein [Pontibacter vulgaris]|uniref:hypothetical protein n=1 Tax=Pontibacter vulgaris TaxID=2905679 RepID=UPI001FA7055D|nr:hypothetical protein [Pontibacter vulgaris]